MATVNDERNNVTAIRKELRVLEKEADKGVVDVSAKMQELIEAKQNQNTLEAQKDDARARLLTAEVKLDTAMADQIVAIKALF